MIICEVGLNHLGDSEYANEYVDAVIDSRADGILFHLREQPFYETKEGAKLALPDEYYIAASRRLRKYGIKFGITIANVQRIDFCEQAKVDFYKIFSRDIGYSALINNLAMTQKTVFVATGVSSISEIGKFVKSIKGYKKNFTLVHTQLTNEIDAVNLRAIELLKEKFHMPVAYGNHAANTHVLYLSLAYEPSDILFYVKGTKVRRHIDDPHAVHLADLPDIIKDLKELPKAIGKAAKLKMESSIR